MDRLVGLLHIRFIHKTFPSDVVEEIRMFPNWTAWFKKYGMAFRWFLEGTPQGFFQNDALNFLNSPFSALPSLLKWPFHRILVTLLMYSLPTSVPLEESIYPTHLLPTYHLYAQGTLPLWTHHVAARYTPPRHGRRGGRCLVRNSYHSQSCRRPKLLTRWDESSNPSPLFSIFFGHCNLLFSCIIDTYQTSSRKNSMVW